MLSFRTDASFMRHLEHNVLRKDWQIDCRAPRLLLKFQVSRRVQRIQRQRRHFGVQKVFPLIHLPGRERWRLACQQIG